MLVVQVGCLCGFLLALVCLDASVLPDSQFADLGEVGIMKGDTGPDIMVIVNALPEGYKGKLQPHSMGYTCALTGDKFSEYFILLEGRPVKFSLIFEDPTRLKEPGSIFVLGLPGMQQKQLVFEFAQHRKNIGVFYYPGTESIQVAAGESKVKEYEFEISKEGSLTISHQGTGSNKPVEIGALVGETISNGTTAIQFSMSVINATTGITAKFGSGFVGTVDTTPRGGGDSGDVAEAGMFNRGWLQENKKKLLAIGMMAGGALLFLPGLGLTLYGIFSKSKKKKEKGLAAKVPANGSKKRKKKRVAASAVETVNSTVGTCNTEVSQATQATTQATTQASVQASTVASAQTNTKKDAA